MRAILEKNALYPSATDVSFSADEALLPEMGCVRIRPFSGLLPQCWHSGPLRQRLPLHLTVRMSLCMPGPKRG